MSKATKRVFRVWVGVTEDGEPYPWSSATDRRTCLQHIQDGGFYTHLKPRPATLTLEAAKKGKKK